MATPPLDPDRRQSALNERLRLLDDAFIPALTPTNTWLSNVRRPDDDEEEENYDDDTPTEEEPSVHSRRNRFEEASKTITGADHYERKTSCGSTSSEPRSSSFPPAIHPKAAASSLTTSGAPSHNDLTIEEPSRPEGADLLEVNTYVRRAATDP